MNKVAPSRVAPTQAENNKPLVNTSEGLKTEDLLSLFVKDRRVANASSGNTYNLTGIPVRPKLSTPLQIQRCTKDGGHCDCPKCTAEREGKDKEVEIADAELPKEESIPEEAPQDQEDIISKPVQEQESAEHVQAETPEPDPHFLVDDATTDLSDGQLRKSIFLRSLRESISNTIEPVLATVGQTTQGCPYLNYWLGSYENKGAEQVERTVRRYAPAAANARSAGEYISIVTQRALQAAQVWARTGKITGVPEGVSVTLPGSFAEHAGPGCIVQAKEKSGGVKNTNDPRSIQKQLGDGLPLNSSVRTRMESAFGMSFAHVRTHTDSKATTVSNQVNARAFTVGNHVAFNSGEYQPGTPMGDALIAHELAHTVQQQGATDSVASIDQHDTGYQALEHDADKTATTVIENLYADTKNSARMGISSLRTGLAVQRCCSTKSATRPVSQTVTVDMVKLRGSSRDPAADLTRASAIFNACNVGFTTGQNITAADADSDAWLGGDTDLAASNACGTVSTEEKNLFDGAKTKYGLSSRMKLFFVDTFSNVGSAVAYSYPPYCATGAASPYVDHAVITNSAYCDTVAHELGHILINSGDHTGIDNPSSRANIMVSPDRTDPEIDATQCLLIRANI